MTAITVRNVGTPINAMIRDLDAIQRQAVPKAAARALNRSNSRCRTLTGRRAAAKFGIKVTKAKRAVAIPAFRRARKNKLSASGSVLMYLKEIDARGKGQKVVFSKGKSARPYYGSPGWFLAEMPNGHRGIFVRKPEAKNSRGRDRKGRPRRNRLPIQEVYVDVSDKIFRLALEVLDGVVGKEWEQRFLSALEFELSKLPRPRRR